MCRSWTKRTTYCVYRQIEVILSQMRISMSSFSFLRSSCVPFMTPFHDTATLLSFHKHKPFLIHTHTHTNAFTCVFCIVPSAPPIDVLKNKCFGASSLFHLSWAYFSALYVHRGEPFSWQFSSLRDMTNPCVSGQLFRYSCTLPGWNGNSSSDCGGNLCFS